MNDHENLPDHFRFRETYHGEGVEIHCEKWIAIRETAQGYWVIPSMFQGWPQHHIDRHKKWVHKRSVRRYCYPDQAQAFKSYRIRKQRQLGHLELQLAVVKQVVEKIAALNGNLPEHRPAMAPISCGKPELFNKYCWEVDF